MKTFPNWVGSVHFTRIINLQCARIRQSVVNETSSGEKPDHHKTEILRIRLARKKIIHPRLILHRINCRIIRAQLKIFRKKGIQEQSRKMKKIKKISSSKRKDKIVLHLLITIIAVPSFTFLKHQHQILIRISGTMIRIHIIHTIMNTYKAKNVLFFIFKQK